MRDDGNDGGSRDVKIGGEKLDDCRLHRNLILS